MGILGPPYCGIGATIRIGREILCLPYAGFFLVIYRTSRKKLTAKKLSISDKYARKVWKTSLFANKLAKQFPATKSMLIKKKSLTFGGTLCVTLHCSCAWKDEKQYGWTPHGWKVRLLLVQAGRRLFLYPGGTCQDRGFNAKSRTVVNRAPLS